MIVIFLKMLLLIVLMGLAAVLTTLVWLVSGNSMLVTAAGVIAFLFACTVPMTFAVAAAFKRFDVSRDVPD